MDRTFLDLMYKNNFEMMQSLIINQTFYQERVADLHYFMFLNGDSDDILSSNSTRLTRTEIMINSSENKTTIALRLYSFMYAWKNKYPITNPLLMDFGHVIECERG